MPKHTTSGHKWAQKRTKRQRPKYKHAPGSLTEPWTTREGCFQRVTSLLARTSHEKQTLYLSRSMDGCGALYWTFADSSWACGCDIRHTQHTPEIPSHKYRRRTKAQVIINHTIIDPHRAALARDPTPSLLEYAAKNKTTHNSQIKKKNHIRSPRGGGIFKHMVWPFSYLGFDVYIFAIFSAYVINRISYTISLLLL